MSESVVRPSSSDRLDLPHDRSVEARPQLRYVASAAFDAASPGHTLAVVSFGEPPPGPSRRDGLSIDVTLPQLAQPRQVEVWETTGPVTSGVAGDVRFACDGETLVGAIEIESTATDEIESAARHAYDSLLSFADEAGYPSLIRIWNYVPRINETSSGLERYRGFCRARSDSFLAHHGEHFTRRLCASSAVGGSSRLLVFFLAARRGGGHWENPRQVRAYRYPERFGPRSPSFARATTAPGDLGGTLYVSGTASIVGFESCHGGDTLAQLDETLRNIAVIVDRATSIAGDETAPLERLSLLRVYLRRESDFDVVAERLARVVGPEIPRLFLRADICRSELTIEIEAVVSAAGAVASRAADRR